MNKDVSWWATSHLKSYIMYASIIFALHLEKYIGRLNP